MNLALTELRQIINEYNDKPTSTPIAELVAALEDIEQLLTIEHLHQQLTGGN